MNNGLESYHSKEPAGKRHNACQHEDYHDKERLGACYKVQTVLLRLFKELCFVLSAAGGFSRWRGDGGGGGGRIFGDRTGEGN